MATIATLNVRIHAVTSSAHQAVDKLQGRLDRFERTAQNSTAATAAIGTASAGSAAGMNAVAASAGRATTTVASNALAVTAASTSYLALSRALTSTTREQRGTTRSAHAAVGSMTDMAGAAGLLAPALGMSGEQARKAGQAMTFFAAANQFAAGRVSSIGLATRLATGQLNRVQLLGRLFTESSFTLTWASRAGLLLAGTLQNLGRVLVATGDGSKWLFSKRVTGAVGSVLSATPAFLKFAAALGVAKLSLAANSPAGGAALAMFGGLVASTKRLSQNVIALAGAGRTVATGLGRGLFGAAYQAFRLDEWLTRSGERLERLGRTPIPFDRASLDKMTRSQLAGQVARLPVELQFDTSRMKKADVVEKLMGLARPLSLMDRLKNVVALAGTGLVQLGRLARLAGGGLNVAAAASIRFGQILFSGVTRAVFTTMGAFNGMRSRLGVVLPYLTTTAAVFGRVALGTARFGAASLRTVGVLTLLSGKVLQAGVDFTRLAVGAVYAAHPLARLIVGFGSLGVAALALTGNVALIPALFAGLGSVVLGAAGSIATFAAGTLFAAAKVVPLQGVIGAIAPLLGSFGATAAAAAAKLGGLTAPIFSMLGPLAKYAGAALAAMTRSVALNAVLGKSASSMKIVGVAVAALQSVLGGLASSFVSVLAPIAAYTLAVGGLSAGVLGTLVVSQFRSIAALQQQSSSLGLSTNALAEYRHAAMLAGVSTETADASIKNLTKSLVDAGTDKTSAAAGAINELGLKLDDLQSVTPDQQMRVLADALAGVNDKALQTRLAFDLFGKDGVEVLEAMGSGAGGLDKAAEDARKLGLSVSTIDAAQIELANVQFGRLQAWLTGIARQLAVGLAPIIETVIGSLADMAGEAGIATSAADAGFWVMTRSIAFVLDFVENLRQLFMMAEITAVDFAASVVDGFVGIVTSSDFLTSALGLASRAWQNLQIYATQALSAVIKSLAYILSFLPSLPTWLGGSKELNVSGAMNEFAAGLDEAAAAMSTKLNDEIAKGTLADSAIAAARGTVESLRSRADSRRTDLQNRQVQGTAGERFIAEAEKRREEMRGKAAQRAEREVTGVEAIAAQAAAEKDEKDKKDKKGDRVEVGVAEKGSREAFEAIGKARDAARKDKTEENTRKIAAAADAQKQLLTDVRDILRNQGSPGVAEIAPA